MNDPVNGVASFRRDPDPSGCKTRQAINDQKPKAQRLGTRRQAGWQGRGGRGKKRLS